MASAPYQKEGKWYIDKDPDDIRYYLFDVTNDLTDSATTIASVTAVTQGVTAVGTPTVQGSQIGVKLSGMGAAGTESFCTVRVVCANTEQFDRTIWFNRVDN